MLKLSFCGLALTMVAQPNGGLDSCHANCALPAVKLAPPDATAIAVPLPVAKPVRVYGKKRAVAWQPRRQPERVAGRLSGTEFLAISRQDPVGKSSNPEQTPAVSPALAMVAVAPAVRVLPNPTFASQPAVLAKTPEQKAQDAWDARQRLAYIDPILPNEFGYAEVVETASGKLRVVSALTDLHGNSREASGPSAAVGVQEKQNNKSQAPSAPTAEAKLEP